jgi:membrane protein YqaA with SNARE-associated domain
MNFFTNIYDYIIKLAEKKNVTRYLYGLSFIESFIFPIPPDVLLAPIALTRKYNWILIAFNTTLFSVLGGLVGYVIGSYLHDLSILNSFIHKNTFFEVKNLFNQHGFIIIILAGFTPLPFKAFTITAGYMSIQLIPFIIASFIGRAIRFFIVAVIFHYFGKSLANKLKKYFEYIGILITIMIIYIIYAEYF